MAKGKGGLGRGLESLFEDAAPSLESDAKIETLPLREIEPDPDQPRKTFDEEALGELAASIAEHGLLQPIAVRPQGLGGYSIVAGERRWRACRMAGLTEVPVVVKDVSDEQAMELALVENLQREDLNPIEEAKGYKSLIEDYGLTQEEAAKSVGRSRPAITNSMRLLSLSPAVLELVENGSLSAGHARALVPISNEAKQLAAAEEIIKKNLSVRKAEQLAAKLMEEPEVEEEPESKEITVDYSAEVGEQLSRCLGRKVKLIDGKKTGRIELEFYGADDREALIEKLKNLK